MILSRKPVRPCRRDVLQSAPIANPIPIKLVIVITMLPQNMIMPIIAPAARPPSPSLLCPNHIEINNQNNNREIIIEFNAKPTDHLPIDVRLFSLSILFSNIILKV